MRVAWICHFYNEEIQSILHPDIKSSEMAAWIPLFAELFESEKSIELHIISPDRYIPSYRQLTLRGTKYHFFNPTIYFLGYNILDIFNFIDRTEYFIQKIFIRKIINRIQPDIIHLFGAENAYYSSSILQFKNKYPVLISIQGFILKTTGLLNYKLKKRIEIERRILSNLTHFAYCTKSVADDILNINPRADLYFHDYPIPKINQINTEKKYDLVFFARVCKDKGFDDLLQALIILKKNIPTISLCVIGQGSAYYHEMVESLELSQNVYWAGRLPTLKDVHEMAATAKVSVLPTYHDTIPGTIIESMFLKIPVIAYATGGIPEINKNEEFVTLTKIGVVNDLAAKILWLLTHPEVQTQKSERAYERAVEMFNNSKILNDIMNAYQKVIRDFNKKNL